MSGDEKTVVNFANIDLAHKKWIELAGEARAARGKADDLRMMPADMGFCAPLQPYYTDFLTFMLDRFDEAAKAFESVADFIKAHVEGYKFTDADNASGIHALDPGGGGGMRIGDHVFD